MSDDIGSIVEEVLRRLHSVGGGSATPAEPPDDQARSHHKTPHALILTENLNRVGASFATASQRQRQAVSVLVGGSPGQRGCPVGFGRVYYDDEPAGRNFEFVAEFDTFVLCGVNLPSIARIAQLVVTSRLEHIVFDALANSRTVCAEPLEENPQFESLSQTMQREFLVFREQLSRIGVREQSLQTLFALQAAPFRPAETLQERHSPTGRPLMITVRELRESATPGSLFRVNGPYRLTDLAREYSEKHSIRITSYQEAHT